MKNIFGEFTDHVVHHVVQVMSNVVTVVQQSHHKLHLGWDDVLNCNITDVSVRTISIKAPVRLQSHCSELQHEQHYFRLFFKCTAAIKLDF